MPDALYIVDGSNFLFRAYHALPPLTTKAGVPTGAAYGFTNMLIKLEQDHRPSHLAVVFDASAHSFRNELYDKYKEHRPPAPDDLVPQFATVRRVVDAFGIPRLELGGVEADDVIATLAREARTHGLRTVIVSSDKDLMQLVDETCVLVDTMKDVTYDADAVKAKYGVPPKQLGDVLALMGDSVDNVPGVPGIGPKTASSLIAEFGSLDALLARTDDVKMRGADRIKRLLVENADQARLSRRLVALDEHVDLPMALDTFVRREPDMAHLEATLRELEFDRLITRLKPASSTEKAPAPTAEAVPATWTTLTLPDARARIVTDRAALGALAGELEAAGEFAFLVELGEGLACAAPVCGLAFAADGVAPAYVPVGHRYLGAPAHVTAAEALGALAPLLGAKNLRKHVWRSKEAYLATARHHVALDGVVSDPELAAYLLDPSGAEDLSAIARRAGAAVDGRDTLCGTGKKAAAFESIDVERAAAYAGRRAQAALGLGRALPPLVETTGMGALLRDVELPLARVLAVMEATGVRIDAAHLRTLGAALDKDLERLEAEVREVAGMPDLNLGSPKQLEELLFDKLQLPVVKSTRGKTGRSTDKEVLEALAELHPVAAKIHEHRQLAKLKGTYIDALPALVDPSTGRLHTSFNQTVASTGRLSSSSPNLQNIPVRSGVGMEIRRAFVAAPGSVLIAADYSQIELRVLAHLSGDPVLVDSFVQGQDVHTRTAVEVWHVAPEAVTPDQRRIAKAINFGIAYGQTSFGLAKVLGISKTDAQKYIDEYYARYSVLRQYMERLIADAHRERAARTLLGRIRPLPDLDSKARNLRQEAERMARNAPIQGTAADLLKLAMIRAQERLDAEFPSTKMILTVHDELVFEAPHADAERVAAEMKETMEGIWTLKVPLKVDVGIGPTWADC